MSLGILLFGEATEFSPTCYRVKTPLVPGIAPARLRIRELWEQKWPSSLREQAGRSLALSGAEDGMGKFTSTC